MPGGAVHTVCRDGCSLNDVEGQARLIDDAFECEEDAVLAGRRTARDQGVDHRVHHLDGWVHQRTVVEADPRGTSG